MAAGPDVVRCPGPNESSELEAPTAPRVVQPFRPRSDRDHQTNGAPSQFDAAAAHERTMVNGRSFGGVRFTRGQLYKILGNPIYVGQIAHEEIALTTPWWLFSARLFARRPISCFAAQPSSSIAGWLAKPMHGPPLPGPTSPSGAYVCQSPIN
jgi:hypothetical protein